VAKLLITSCKTPTAYRMTFCKKLSKTLTFTLVARILGQRKSELDELSITYEKSAITDMKQLT